MPSSVPELQGQSVLLSRLQADQSERWGRVISAAGLKIER